MILIRTHWGQYNIEKGAQTVRIVGVSAKTVIGNSNVASDVPGISVWYRCWWCWRIVYPAGMHVDMYEYVL